MMGDRSNAISGKSAFITGGNLLSSALAGGLTIALGPLLFRAGLVSVLTYTADQFGLGWDWLFTLLWAAGCAVGTYGFMQMTIALTLRLGMAKLTSIIFRN